MKLSYNVTGTERKALVGAISQELNKPTKYLGAPTFAYEVGGYHIDKNGTITGSDNLDLEAALHQRGFDAAERRYDEPDYSNRGLYGGDAISKLTIEMPLDGFTPEKLDNLFKMVKAKKRLLKATLAVENLPIQQTEETLRFPWLKKHRVRRLQPPTGFLPTAQTTLC